MFINCRLLLILFLFFILGDNDAQSIKGDSLSIKIKIDSLQKLPMSTQTAQAYNDLAEHSHKAKYYNGEAKANTMLGNYYIESAQFSQALEAYQKVISIGELINDTSTIAKGYMSLGIVYNTTGQLQKALDHLLISTELIKDKDDNKLYYSTLGNTGIVYAKMEIYDKALDYLKRNKAGMQKLKNSRRVQTANYNIASIYLEEGKARKALPYSFEYLETAKRSKDSFDICYGYRIFSKTYKDLNRPDKALLYLDSTILLARQISLNRLIPESILDQSQIYEQRGRFDKALDLHQQYTDEKEQLINSETNDKMALLEVQFETERKEKQLLLREKELTELKQLDKIKQLRIWMLIGGLVTLSIIGMLFFMKVRSERLEKKANENLIRSELKIKELKTRQLQSKLSNKESDLTNLALDISRKNEYANQIILKLENLQKLPFQEMKTKVRDLIQYTSSQLQLNDDVALLQENVDTVNQEFYHRLESRFGKLTSNEKYLTGLIRLNLSNKEIAAIKGISPTSVKTSRHRLRKRFDLDPKVDIVDFLQKI